MGAHAPRPHIVYALNLTKYQSVYNFLHNTKLQSGYDIRQSQAI